MRKGTYPKRIYIQTENTVKKIHDYQVKYKNIVFLAISFIVAFYIFRSPTVMILIENLGRLGYPASFVAGIFFTYGITTVPATVVIFNLGQNFNPFWISLIGAAGSVISDYIIFRFVRDRLIDEIKLLSKDVKHMTKPVSSLFFWEELRIRIWQAISKSKIWSLLIPVIGGLVIASPLPDEMGAAIFGAVKFNPKKFMIIAYLMNFIGIFLVAYSSRVIF